MIKFNVSPRVESGLAYIQRAILNNKTSGDGEFTKKCSEWIEKRAVTSKALLTSSCTHSLEMSALLCNIKPGDEVIMPSYTFVSTANAFVMRGAKIIFVDIRPDTMNINEQLIENAVSDKTKAIVPVHYAGVCCEMDTIMKIAEKYSLYVIEDAAQAMMSTYKGVHCGTIGDYGCYSFHETKNFSMGEGGALLIRESENTELAEVIREKGTNRSRFFRGEIDKYTWIARGSSYLPSDMNAAYLWAQLEIADEIIQDRFSSWNRYYYNLEHLQKKGSIELPFVPESCQHNGHIFYIKAQNVKERTDLIQYLKRHDINAVSHYIPLHTSKAGLAFGSFSGEDCYTTKESGRLLRLPLYYGLGEENVDRICDCVYKFYRECCKQQQ